METQSLVRHLGSWSVGKGSLQQKLVRGLTGAVGKGLLLPGTRLPSERTLAQSLMLSRTTVVAAYDALREAGWFESRTGSGTWVSATSRGVAAARSSGRPAVLELSPLLNMMENRENDTCIDFTFGSPPSLHELSLDLFTIPPDEYAALVADHRYYPLGMRPLRQAVARMYSQNGLDTTEEQVLITNGAQGAISLCASLYLQRGDTVLVEDPCYFGALDVFRTAEARIAPLPVGPDGVRPAQLRERIKNSAARLVYLTPTYQNPTGRVMPSAARKEVSRIVTESGVPVIDDRVLADLVLDGAAPPPLAAYAPESAIITIGSLSKLIWPGLRAGWIRAPGWIIDRLARLKTSLELSSPLPTQHIAARLMEHMGEARQLRRLQLKPRRDLLAALLRKQLPEWTFRVPSGGLFLWVQLPRGDARELAQAALRHGVVLLPGPNASAVGRYEKFLRIPFLAEPEILKAGVRRMAAAWKDYQANEPARSERPVVV